MIRVLRTKPSFHNSSGTVSLRSTSTTAAAAAVSRSRIFASPIAQSLSVCRFGFLVCVRKQQIMDLPLEPGGAAVFTGNLVDVGNFGLDPSRVRRQQQDAVADLDGFGNRMGDEQHRELGFGPELQQFVLTGAPRQRIECCERLLAAQRYGVTRPCARA